MYIGRWRKHELGRHRIKGCWFARGKWLTKRAATDRIYLFLWLDWCQGSFAHLYAFPSRQSCGPEWKSCRVSNRYLSICLAKHPNDGHLQRINGICRFPQAVVYTQTQTATVRGPRSRHNYFIHNISEMQFHVINHQASRLQEPSWGWLAFKGRCLTCQGTLLNFYGRYLICSEFEKSCRAGAFFDSVVDEIASSLLPIHDPISQDYTVLQQ